MNKEKATEFPKIFFGFDKEWELENWHDSCVKNNNYSDKDNKAWELGNIPQDVKIIINNKYSNEETMLKLATVMGNFLKTPETLSVIKKVTDKAEDSWGGK